MTLNTTIAKTVIKIEEEFIPALDKLVADHFAERFSNIPVPTHIAKIGKKNAKIVTLENRDGVMRNSSVHCFIDLETGDVLKAKSWKAAEHNFTRGNIFSDDNCSVGVGVLVYGTV